MIIIGTKDPQVQEQLRKSDLDLYKAFKEILATNEEPTVNYIK